MVRKKQNMFARKLYSSQHLLWGLTLVAMFIQLAGASPVMAATCDRTSTICEFDTQSTVSVSNLNIVCVSPSPITQEIGLSGDFVIQAHIVLPPSLVTPPSPIIPAGTIVTLHLDATRISGTGLLDGTFYHGNQGTSLGFESVSNTMEFESNFNLIPSQSNEVSPNPVCLVKVSFQVQLYATEVGIPAISASLNTPS
jgi:hypothetical protein